MAFHSLNCDKCYKTFTTTGNYNRHFKAKHSEVRFCRRCPSKGGSKTFYRKYQLVEHLSRFHGYSKTESEKEASHTNSVRVVESSLEKLKQQAVSVEDYSDISDDGSLFNFVQSAKQELKPCQAEYNYLDYLSPISAEDFSMPSENLQELEETFNAIHEELEQRSKENSYDEQMDKQSDDEHSIF